MKKEIYTYPKSSFLSVEKDMGIIVDMILKNENLKKLLYYTSKDRQKRPALTKKQSLELFGKNIKIVPKLYVDKEVLNYLIIRFDNFTPNQNPEFRDNVLEIDIVCHLDQWELSDFQLRPYRIAAELDSIFNHKRLTGVGYLEFIGASQLPINDEFSSFCLMYQTTHGEEDKKKMANPNNEEAFIENFDAIFNDN